MWEGFEIAIKQGYRGIGIGTRIMQTLIEESKKAKQKNIGSGGLRY
jgi:ribosomal protein S18 acetylase RimI-like enzyme